ncbi:MAG: cupredoxin domain-containing protein, partial [Roseiflexaceae bacterium]|nr:cupredoxin domain-containing protein [Roseiflexaceae bacterium]
VVAAPDRPATQQYVLAILTLAEQTLQGVDVNLDEQVGPIAGEGGVITAYQHAQLMASMALTAQDSAAVVPTVAAVAGAPTAAPTTAPVAGAPTAVPAPAATIVDIGDNTFNQQEISVPVGATVMWMSSGQKPHTVTVDDGSFKSATLKNGDMFTHTFDKPGVYAYYCEFHGSAGGQGMAGVIRVGDAASAQQQAPAQEPAAAPLTVSMKDFAFEAIELKVRVGQSVLWKNDGEKPHSATAVDGSFDTGLYGAGESKTVQFNQAGTFLYFCQLHGSQDGTSGMVGTVIVEP